VLHHVASPSRRERLVRELARSLRVGGRALVTVWAREQDDPARTLRRWLPMKAAVSGEEEGPPGGEQHDGGDYLVPWHMPVPKRAAAAAAGAAAAGGNGDGDGEEGGKRAGASNGNGGGGGAGASTPAPAGLPGVPPELAAPRLDPGKRSVVYGRYYHLFGAGELEALVAAAVGGGGEGDGGSGGAGESGGGGLSGGSPRCVVVETFFDKSNWCVTFERVE
jgi:alkylated DNA repair protein alkB family protein 8